MIYTKPSVASLSQASAAIQEIGGDKGLVRTDADIKLQPQLSTGGSYDLDE
jgi:hypothetical protein